MTTLEEMIPKDEFFQVSQTPKCQRCGTEMIIDEHHKNGVMICFCPVCDLPPEEPKHHFRIYQNHCWNCGAGIDSRFCVPSRIVGMGYHCPRCGEDLTKWKQQRRIV